MTDPTPEEIEAVHAAVAQCAPIPTPAGYRQVGTMFVATEPDDDGTYEAVAIERFGDPDAHRPKRRESP